MSLEFPDIYNDLMQNSYRLFRRVLLAKLLAMKHSRTNKKYLEEQLQNKQGITDSEVLRLKAMVSTRTNKMIEFNPFDLEQVEEIESDDILTSELDSQSDSSGQSVIVEEDCEDLNQRTPINKSAILE